MLQHALFTVCPNSPIWPPSFMTSTGFLLQPTSDSKQWCWPSRPSMELHPSASKHWSDHMPQREHFTLLHQLAGWYRHRWEQTKPVQRSRDFSGGTSSPPMSGQQNHSPSSAKDSRLICTRVEITNLTIFASLAFSNLQSDIWISFNRKGFPGHYFFFFFLNNC